MAYQSAHTTQYASCLVPVRQVSRSAASLAQAVSPLRAPHLLAAAPAVGATPEVPCSAQIVGARRSSVALTTRAVPMPCGLQIRYAKQPPPVVTPDRHEANQQLPTLLGSRSRIVKGPCANHEAFPVVEATQEDKHLWDSNASASLALAKQDMLDSVFIGVESLTLGEDLFRDYLQPSAGLPAETVQQNLEYMRELVLHMKATGRAPDTECIDVNQDGVVIGGNHRVLAAWLLRWPTINCCGCGHKAGWRVPLAEEHRKPLEALLGLEQSAI